ncbi:MAG: elongation factor P [Bacteroidota bacterium]
MPKITTGDFHNGICLELAQDLYTLLEFQHVKPGKGKAFVRTKLKSLTTEKVIEHTFSAGVKVIAARVERRPYQFLYKDALGYHLMDHTSFDQITVAESLVNAPQWLVEGQTVEVLVHQETNRLLSCTLPPFVNLKVTYTEPGLKGDTATRALKTATLETGHPIQVPLFIDNEDLLKIDTRTNAYVERVKQA